MVKLGIYPLYVTSFIFWSNIDQILHYIKLVYSPSINSTDLGY